MADNMGIKLEAEGYGEFKKSLKDIEQSFKVLGSEMKLVASQFDKSDTSVAALTAKNQVLNKQIDEQKGKVGLLESALKQSADQYGENDSRTQKWAIELNNAKAKLNDVEREVKQNESAMSGLESETKSLGNSLDDVGNKTDNLKSEMSNIGDALKSAGTAITATIAAIGAALVGSAESTREYRTDMGKLETAFATSGKSAEDAKNTYSELYSILGDSGQTTEAASHLAKLANSQKELSDWTNICTGVYATFGDSLPIEGLTEAANETAKVGQVTGPLADALNWAGISEDKFNESLAACNSEKERTALITETLNGLYGAASEKYKELNKDVIDANKAQERLNDAMAKVGAEVEPIITSIKNSFADLVEQLLPALDDLPNMFKSLMDTINNLIPAFVGATAAVIAYKTASAISGVIDALRIATEGQTIAQAALNMVMNANPFVLIGTLIAGVAAALVTLWNTNEGFREAVTGIWESIKETFVSAWEGIKTAWSAVGEFFTGIWDSIELAFNDTKEWFSDIFNKAFDGIKVVWDLVSPYFSAVWDTIKGVFDVVKSVLSGDFQGAWDAIKGIVNVWAEYFQGIWNNIKNVFSDAFDWGKKMITAVWDGMKKAWEDVKSWFKGVWDGLFGNNTANVTVNKKVVGDGVDGSNANGLDYVPFDGYISELHKGEMVIPANLADGLRNIGITAKRQTDFASLMSSSVNAINMQSGSKQHITVELPTYLNGKEVSRAIIPDFWAVMSATPRVLSDPI